MADQRSQISIAACLSADRDDGLKAASYTLNRARTTQALCAVNLITGTNSTGAFSSRC
jgi:hypothetical protein